jgi:hypothetical protein
MNVQELLDMLKDYGDKASEHREKCWKICDGTLKAWADTLEQHLTPKPDGRADRGEASVIQSAKALREMRQQFVVMAAGAAQASAILQKLGLDVIADEVEDSMEHLLNTAIMLPISRGESTPVEHGSETR